MNAPHIEPGELKGVREHGEGYPVELCRSWVTVPEQDRAKTGSSMMQTGRWCIYASNEGDHNSTAVDLFDLLAWIKANKPELLTYTDPESFQIAKENL